MTAQSQVIYAREDQLDIQDFRRVLAESGLGASRPIDDHERLRHMVSSAGLIITARLDTPSTPLVGVAHCVTDFSWCCYVSELAVSAFAQHQGIGMRLLQTLRSELGPTVSIILISVPDAMGFYERIGMSRLTDAFWYRRER